MAAIVFLAVFRSSMSAVWGALGLLGLGIALMVGIRVYRRIRAASETSAADV
jgi:putative membrane protein